MDPIELSLPTAWMTGYLASLVRVGALVAATPILNRRIPAAGRTVLTIGVGLAFVEPLEVDGLLDLVVLVLTNAVVGLVLGFLVGVVWLAFLAAGSLIDQSSGLAIGATFDPLTGAQVSVFDRVFDLAAVTLFLLMGGDRLLVAGLGASTRAVPLDGRVDLSDGLVEVAIERTGWVITGAVQIAAPALAALFLAELVLGIGSRMLPQFNVFLVGIPGKILLGIAACGVLLIGFPGQTGILLDEADGVLVRLLGGLGG